MVDPSFIGLSGPEFDFPIELGKVREFANALYAYQSAYLEGNRPVIPPTYPIIAGYLWGYMLEAPGGTPLAQMKMDTSLPRPLDGEQEFVYCAPLPRAGDHLTARTWVDNIWEKPGRRGGKLTFYRMRSDYHNRAGLLVGTNYATSIVPEGVPATTPPEVESSNLPFFHRNDMRDQLMAVNQANWDGLVEGSGPGPIMMPALTLTDIVRYAIVSGLYGATHYDAAAARASGFPTYFSVGMFHGGLLGTYAVNWLGAENVRRLRLRFMDMIWPGERLSYSGSVANKHMANGERVVDIELDCARENGEVVTKGWATFAVP